MNDKAEAAEVNVSTGIVLSRILRPRDVEARGGLLSQLAMLTALEEAQPLVHVLLHKHIEILRSKETPLIVADIPVSFVDPSVGESNAVFLCLGGHVKTGHSWPPQNRPLTTTRGRTFLLLCLRVRQVVFNGGRFQWWSFSMVQFAMPRFAEKKLVRIGYRPRSEVGTTYGMADFPTDAFVFNYDRSDLDGG